MYTASAILLTLGLSYASVPLYRLYCSATGLGGTPSVTTPSLDPEKMRPTGEKRFRVTFQSQVSPKLPWQFIPEQHHIDVLPGETALAFYNERNLSKEDIIGVATYNVSPAKVGPYFNKIQCFCFEEQWLRAGEEVDMPVFFFLDPEIMDDPAMWDVDDVVLAYTFFKASNQDHLQQLIQSTTNKSNPVKSVSEKPEP